MLIDDMRRAVSAYRLRWALRPLAMAAGVDPTGLARFAEGRQGLSLDAAGRVARELGLVLAETQAGRLGPLLGTEAVGPGGRGPDRGADAPPGMQGQAPPAALHADAGDTGGRTPEDRGDGPPGMPADAIAPGEPDPTEDAGAGPGVPLPVVATAHVASHATRPRGRVQGPTWHAFLWVKKQRRAFRLGTVDDAATEAEARRSAALRWPGQPEPIRVADHWPLTRAEVCEFLSGR